MKRIGKGKWVEVFEGVLMAVWLVAMGLAGSFLPGFLTTFPVFEIKGVYVYGLRSVPADAFSLGVYQVSKNNWLFLDSERLLEKVNELTGNSVEDVKVERVFSLDGVRVNVYVKERVPVALDRIKRLYSSVGEKQVEIFMTSDGIAVIKESVKVSGKAFPL
jgi:cell division protein FtsQ